MKVMLVALLCFTLTMFVKAQTSHPPTVAEAEAFMNKAEARLAELAVKVEEPERALTFVDEALPPQLAVASATSSVARSTRGRRMTAMLASRVATRPRRGRSTRWR